MQQHELSNSNINGHKFSPMQYKTGRNNILHGSNNNTITTDAK